MSSQAQVSAAFYQALYQQVLNTFGAVGHGAVVAVSQANQYPWQWLTATANFNQDTYTFLDTTAVGNADGTVTLSQSSFVQKYQTLLNTITYKLNGTDQAAQTASANAAAGAAGQVVLSWKQNVGPVPAGPGQPIDQIIQAIRTTWAATTVSYDALRTSSNLRGLLVNAPPSGSPVLAVLANYLSAAGAGGALTAAVTNGNGEIASILANIQQPTAATGGITLADMNGNTRPVPGLSVQQQFQQTSQELSNAQSSLTITLSATKSNATTMQMHIDGGASFSVPILGFLSIGASASASKDVLQSAGDFSSCTVTITWTGLSRVDIARAQYSREFQDGWYDPSVVTDAVQNGSTVSGFQFTVAPSVKFGQGGTFGALKALFIAQQPTVNVTVAGSNYQKFQESWGVNASGSVSLFGFIPLGGANYSKYESTSQASSEAGSFTLTMAPAPASMAASSGLATVLAAGLDYPGAVGAPLAMFHANALAPQRMAASFFTPQTL